MNLPIHQQYNFESLALEVPFLLYELNVIHLR